MRGGGGVVSPRMAGNAGDSHLPPSRIEVFKVSGQNSTQENMECCSSH